MMSLTAQEVRAGMPDATANGRFRPATCPGRQHPKISCYNPLRRSIDARNKPNYRDRRHSAECTAHGTSASSTCALSKRTGGTFNSRRNANRRSFARFKTPAAAGLSRRTISEAQPDPVVMIETQIHRRNMLNRRTWRRSTAALFTGRRKLSLRT